jgi:voltage-gated potassium channel
MPPSPAPRDSWNDPTNPLSLSARPRSRSQSDDESRDRWAGYDAFILAFSLLTIGMLVLGVAVELGPSSRSILAYADAAICMVFLVDFAVSLSRADDRWRYLVTWGWLDLLSAMPVIDAARWGRAARLIRILRVIRGIKATHMIASMLFKQRSLNTVMAGAFVAILAIFSSSFAILAFEEAGGGNIRTADDAVWWAICTVTTVGYGDLYPITWEGRVVGFFLMVTGAATFGTLAGLLASWFMGTDSAAEQDEIKELREEMVSMRLLLESHLGRSSGVRAAQSPAEAGGDPLARKRAVERFDKLQDVGRGISRQPQSIEDRKVVVAGEDRVAVPDASRGAHPVEVFDHCGRGREASSLGLQAAVGVFDEHGAVVVLPIPGETAPPVAVATNAPDEASGRIREDVVHLQASRGGIEDTNVGLMRHLRIVGVGTVDPPFVEEAAVEVSRSVCGGQGQEPTARAVVGGHRRVGDRVEPAGISESRLRGIR